MQTRQKYWFGLAASLAVLVCSIDTARAQSNPLTAFPSQLTFNGVNSQPQVLQISSISGQINVTVAAVSNGNWLKVSPPSGATPLQVSVSVTNAAPSFGTSPAFVIITGGASALSVPVAFNADSSGAPSPLSVQPSSLNFTFSAGSTVAATQTVSISSNSSSAGSFTTSTLTSNGGSWLTVNPSASTLPLSNPLQVTVNPTLLQGAGPFSAAVAINPPGSTGVILPVFVTLAGTPSVTLSPSQFMFAYQTGTPAPAAQTLSITSSTGAPVSFTVSAKTTVTPACPTSWIVLSQQSGATPGTINVQMNPSGLSPGTCSGEIDVSAPGASNPNPPPIPVTLLVSNLPLLQVPSSGPTFTYQLGSTTIPAAQNVQITSSTPGLNFNASAAAAAGAPNFLLLNTATGTTPQAIAVSLNQQVLSTLGPGTYTEAVNITSGGAGNSPQSFPVTLVVNSNPILTASVPSLNFNYQVGQPAPSAQTITVNSTGAPLSFLVTASSGSNCQGFLSATPASGLTFGNQNQVVVSVNTTGLTPQLCNGNVTLSVPNSTTPSLVIPVTLDVSNTALLNVGQQAINVSALVGAPATTQTVSVTSTDNTPLQFTAIAATNPVGLTWLGVDVNLANTPYNLKVTVNPANLGPGTYTGSITVSATSPNIPAQVIPVTLVVASSTISANPTALNFVQTVNGAQPAAQMVQISGVPAGTTIGAVATMFNGTGWLATSASGNTVTVNTNGSQLPLGTFQGVVTVIVPGASNSPFYIPVTLTVGNLPTLLVSPASMTFAYTAGSSTLPPSQSIQVTSSGANIPFNATFTPNASIANRGNFVTVAPASGTTPATLTVALNSALVSSFPPGAYSGTVDISSPGIGSQSVVVTVTISPAPTPVVMAIANAASIQAGPISPGEIVSIFGSGVGPAAPAGGISFSLTASGMVPTSLGGVTVTFNGVAAPLLFVSALQVNAIVPYEIAGQPLANVVVQFGGSTSAALQTSVVDTRPAIFSLSQGGSGQGAILNQDYSVNGANQPAPKLSVIQIFATGEGQLVPAVLTGSVTPAVPPFPKPVAMPVTVTIGGQPATIQYAGEAPTLVSGVIQVNAVVPDSIASGNQTVVLTIGSNSNNTQTITVAVQ